MIPAVLDLFVLPLLGLSFLLASLRLLRGPSLADRAAALDLLAALSLGFAAAATLRTGQAAFLDLALVVGVVGFLGSVGFAWHLEQRALARKEP